jgi:hypothetical protein
VAGGQCAAWVRAHLGRLLAGQAAVVAADLEEAAPAPALSKVRRPVAQQTAAYYRRNLPYMLRRLPSGHLIRDRIEQAGMCWTLAGAQAVLDLRAVRLNDHWDDYWAFHRQQQQQRLYGATAPPARAPETRALEVAA